MKNVFITGVSGYLGMKVTGLLAKNDAVSKIIGIDIKEPAVIPDKLIFLKHDVRDPVVDLLKAHSIDTVVHMAYIVAQLHSDAEMEDINFAGSRNIFNASAQAQVSHILYTSSATAYGAHPDNDIPLTEESPLRGNDDFIYAKNKKEIEQNLIQPFIRKNPDITFTVLRPCFVTGPNFISNPLARYLTKRIVMLPSKTAPFQYMHEDDLARIVEMCLEKSINGVYNVGGEGTITFREMVEMLGNKILTIPPGLMYVLNNISWFLRLSFLTEASSSSLNLVYHSWIVSPKRLIDETGFEYYHDTRSAFEDFVRSIKGGN